MIGKIGAMAGLLCCATAFGQATDSCASAPIVPAGTVAFDLTAATNDGSSSCGFTSGSNVDQWVRYTAPNAGNGVISTCNGATFDTVITVFDGCGGGELACNDDACLLQSSVSVPMTQGATYLIRIAPYGAAAGGAGNLTITAPVPPLAGTWSETADGGGDAGDTPATAQVITGSGDLPAIVGEITTGDADMYSFNLCTPASFSASTVNGDTAGDTQLFLFNTSGVGIVLDDDDPSGAGGLRSALSSAFTASLAPGSYLLAISRYNNDPQDAAAALLWANAPFDTERAPDGPAAANPVASWTGGGGTGTYRITMTGSCHGGGGGGCPADTDDGTRTGTPDGAVTIDDLVYFLIRFEEGC